MSAPRYKVPKEYLDKFAFMKSSDETACYAQSKEGFTPLTSQVYPGFGNNQNDYSCRAQYAAMVSAQGKGWRCFGACAKPISTPFLC